MDEETAMRFGWLLSEVELGAHRIRAGEEQDIPLALTRLELHLFEAKGIAFVISREALEKMEPGQANPSTE